MADQARIYRWWEQADAALLEEIHARIADGASYASIFEELDLAIRCDVAQRTFEEYATRYKRGLRIERATERANYRMMLCQALGIDLGALNDPVTRLKVGTAIEVITSQAKAGVKLRALAAQNFTEEIELKKAKNAREEEKLNWQRQKRAELREAVEQKTEGGRTLTRDAVYDLVDRVMRGEA